MAFTDDREDINSFLLTGEPCPEGPPYLPPEEKIREPCPMKLN